MAYGYDLGYGGTPENFLEGVTSATPARRLVALTTCGVVAGVGWWAVFRFGKPLVSIGEAVGKGCLGPPMPPLTTTAHAVLQILTVALGSPLGREVAPREIGAVLATQFASRAALSREEQAIAIACGAGAGLAAVYNVPLGGAALALEVLLGTLAPGVLVAALAASVIAATVAWIGLGDLQQYTVPSLAISAPLIIGSCILGPLCGIAAYAFRQLRRRVTRHKPEGWKRIPWAVCVFITIGGLAMLFPQLPGNGKGPAQLGLAGDIGLRLAASLLLLKVFAVAVSLRAGAAGGVLTPSFTIGALLATVLAHGWNALFPAVPSAAFAIVGAAAFLASSMAMPLTAIVLTIEFTHIGHDLWTPMLLAVAGSVAAAKACPHLQTPKLSKVLPSTTAVISVEENPT